MKHEAKLWLDDVRPGPEGWIWARTVEEARVVLTTYAIVECSLDHDMGLHMIEELPEDPDELLDLFQKARIEGAHEKEETGLDLVHWMIEHNCVPPVVLIHSWNPDGAAAMAARLNYYGHDCYIEPYKVPS